MCLLLPQFASAQQAQEGWDVQSAPLDNSQEEGAKTFPNLLVEPVLWAKQPRGPVLLPVTSTSARQVMLGWLQEEHVHLVHATLSLLVAQLQHPTGSA